MSLRRKEKSGRGSSRTALTNDDAIDAGGDARRRKNEDDEEYMSDDADMGHDNKGADLEEEAGGEGDESTTPEEVKEPGKFQKLLGKIWKTQLTQEVPEDSDEDANELVVISSFRELGIYMGFVIILCVMTFGVTSKTTYYFTQTMADMFYNGPGVEGMTMTNDFWGYIEEPLIEGLYWDKYYNDMELPEAQKGFILHANKLLGSPRLRQVRVGNQSCSIAKNFRGDITECFAPYSSFAETKDTYGFMNGTAWNYQSESELGGHNLWGHISTYQGGGFVELLGLTKEKAVERIAKLKEHLWVDQSTRAVIIDFTVYNANVNLFCVVTIVFEFPATGGILPSSHFKTLKLLRYVTTLDTVVLGFEILFFIYLLFYSIEECIEIRIHGRTYFQMDMWNYFDSVLLFFGFITVFFTVYVYFEVKGILHDLLHVGGERFANFTTLAAYQQMFNQFSAVFVFLAWVKIFKFMTFNKTMTLLQTTLSTCAKDIAGFAVMFFIVFLAYAQWGYLIFGTHVYDFSAFHRAIYTLFRVILGDFDFPAIEKANRIVGPVFFISYVFSVFFILINMFLAIINDTYAEVKEDMDGDDFYLGDVFKKQADKVLTKLKLKRMNIADIQNALQNADTDGDKKVNFEEWRAELRARGHDDDAIEKLFAKFDTDGDRVLSMSELAALNENLAKQQTELRGEMMDIDENMDKLSKLGSDESANESESESEDFSAPPERKTKQSDLDMMAKRVDRVHNTVGGMLYKIDALLMKIDTMERAKSKRRSTMNRLLDIIVQQGGKDGTRKEMEKLVHDELEKWDVDMDWKQDEEEDQAKKKNL